jgi:hypothetical protein
MLITGLILSQSGLVFMVAYKSNLETFAAFKRIRDAGPSNKKASRFNTGEVFQCPEFGNEGSLPHGLWMVNVFDGGNITQGA